jgi:hypothetical protein
MLRKNRAGRVAEGVDSEFQSPVLIKKKKKKEHLRSHEKQAPQKSKTTGLSPR